MKNKLTLHITIFLALTLTLSSCTWFSKQQTTPAAPSVLFSDDFSNPASGWDQTDSDASSAGYSNGAYVIKVNQAQYLVWTHAGQNFTDVDIEVDATLTSGTENNEFGLMCRYQDADNYYFAEIASDGYFAIGKETSGERVYLTNDFEATTLVTAGNTANHLRMTCSGETITLYINGMKAPEVTDSTYATGDIGLIAGTFDDAQLEISFDNLEVKQP